MYQENNSRHRPGTVQGGTKLAGSGETKAQLLNIQKKLCTRKMLFSCHSETKIEKKN